MKNPTLVEEAADSLLRTGPMTNSGRMTTSGRLSALLSRQPSFSPAT